MTQAVFHGQFFRIGAGRPRTIVLDSSQSYTRKAINLVADWLKSDQYCDWIVGSGDPHQVAGICMFGCSVDQDCWKASVVVSEIKLLL